MYLLNFFILQNQNSMPLPPATSNLLRLYESDPSRRLIVESHSVCLLSPAFFT